MGWEPVDPIEKLLKQADGQPPDEEQDAEPEGDRIVIAHDKASASRLHPSVLYVRQPMPHPAAPKDPEESVSVLRELRQVEHTPLQVMHAVKAGDVREVGRPREQVKALILMLLAQAEQDGMRSAELEGKVIAAGFAAGASTAPASTCTARA